MSYGIPLASNSLIRALNHPSCDDLIFSHSIAPLLDKRSALIFSNAVFTSPHIKSLVHKADIKKIHQDIGKQHLKKMPDDLNQELFDAMLTTNRYVLVQLLNHCPKALMTNAAFSRAAASGDVEGVKIIIKSLGMYEAAKVDFLKIIKWAHIDVVEFLMDPQNDIPMNIDAAIRGVYRLFTEGRQKSIKKVLFHNRFPAIELIIHASDPMTFICVKKFYEFLNENISKHWIQQNSSITSFRKGQLIRNAAKFSCDQILVAAIENFPDEMTDLEEEAWRDCLQLVRTRGQNELTNRIQKKLSKASSHESCAS